ncbi:MAG: FHA domain-containing protein [Pseudomonadota bacterium]|nr:FHA domain-containing protein [Pseudomonadota bacterium]
MPKLIVRQDGQIVKELILVEGQEYIGGRDESCQIVLSGKSGVSRQHFKLYFNGNQWQVDVISKFGHLNYQAREVHVIALEDSSAFSLPPFDFQLVAEKSIDTPITEPIIEDNDSNDNTLAIENENLPVVANEVNPNSVADANEFAGDSDDTSPGHSVGEPVVTLINSRGEDLGSIALREGNLWVAGRDENCDIKIPERKSSRRHFEIARSQTGFVLTDLGSANGTKVNQKIVKSKDSIVLSAGDIIKIGSLKIKFDIVNTHLQEQIQNLPDLLFNQTVVAQNLNLPLAYGEPMTPAVGDGYSARPAPKSLLNPKSITIIGLVLLIIYGLVGEVKSPVKKDSRVVVSDEPMNNLDPRQKQFVKETYLLAQSLYSQGKYQLAADNLKKIHELVPYLDKSKELEQDCKRALERIEDQLEQDRQQKIAKDNQEKVGVELARCKSLFGPRSTVQSVNDCLVTALQIDPGNAAIQELVSLAEKQEQDRTLKLSTERDQQEKINRGLVMFRECEKLQKDQQLYLARKKCQEFVSTSLPDPSGNKGKAQRFIANIEQTLVQKIAQLLKGAQEMAGKDDFRGAFKSVREALKMNPTEPEIKEAEDTLTLNMNKKLKTFYQDAKLEESLGNIQVTKEKCNKVLELSIPENDYYNNCKKILRKYGE